MFGRRRAIEAGIDLLLVSYDVDQYFTIMHCLPRATRDDTLDSPMLTAGERRLKRLATTLGAPPSRAL
ncbi:MAG: hypothetical protein QM739_06880 [Propionivibrio sp.]